MDPLRNEVADLVQQTCKIPPIAAADYGKPLKAMGIDSLDAASIFLAVMERYGVAVADEQIELLNCVDKIADHIASQRP